MHVQTQTNGYTNICMYTYSQIAVLPVCVSVKVQKTAKVVSSHLVTLQHAVDVTHQPSVVVHHGHRPYRSTRKT